MRILALDTSTELSSVAVLVDGELAAELSARTGARHGETLLANVEHALSLAGVDRRALDLVAVGLGPGSFTGTRVGVAAAKGLALGLAIPLVGVSSLEAIAYGAPRATERLGVVVDAHKGEIYGATFGAGTDGLSLLVEPFHAAPEGARARLGEAVLVGSGLRRYPEAFAGAATLPRVFDAPRAAMIAALGMQRFEQRGPDDRDALTPLYVRGADATLPTPGA